MSFDLYENENLDAVSSMAPVQDVPAGFFDGFGKVPQLAMRSAAVAGRATSLLASAPLVLLDRIKGDTDLEDRYFKQHEDVFQRAVDYWTPKPNEVGTAAQVVGDMLFTLPTAIAAPPIALGSAYAGTAEDLVRQGVDPAQAQAVGGVQSAGLALGLWMPILGKNLWQRTVVGGAGFNALQGIATRGASEAILSDTEAKDQFHAFDGEALTLDVLMGLGFGTFAHLSPEQRAQGEATWNRISEWAQQMSPSQKAAIATLREAQHLNVDSVPGKPVDPVDVEAHVNRMRQAIDQLVNDQPVQVSDLPEPKLEADPAREAQTQENYRNLADAAEQVRQDEGIPQVSEVGKTITERLMDIGVPPQEAADKGLLWDSFFKSMESRTGQDASQLFGKYYDRVFNAGEALPEDAIMQSAHLETPEFKGWFGDSKVVDAEGKPLVVYRGEGRGGERNVYDSSQSRENAIFMTPEKDVARVYEKGNAEPRAFYVKAERLLDLTEDTRETRKFIREWAKNWDDWTDRQSGEQVDPVDVVFGGRLFDYEGDWSSERWRDLQATALENHDAAYLVDWHDGPFKALIVKGGSQIKSATGNRGTFDPNDPNILKQSAPVFYSQLSKSIEDAPAKVFGTGKQLKGEFGNKQEAEKARDPNDPDMQPAIILTDAMKAKAQEGMPLFQGNRGFLEFKGSKMGIGLLASADRSTFLHESGHFFLEVMNDLSKEAEPLRADIDALHQWMGVQGDTPEARAQAWDAMSLDEKRPMHEQFARGFEQYLMEGKAPNSRLAEAFARFRDWLIEIYKSATALNVQITDEVRAVMDRMLDSKAKAPQSPPGGDVPPPRVMAGEATAADLDKVLASGEPNLENHKPLSDPDVQGMLQDMALNEAGWAEKGGYLLRSGSEVAGEEVISRTKWIPKAEWWADRPAQGKRRLNEEQVKEAVRKAIAGEPLKPLEQSTVDFMAAIANDRIQGVEQVGPNGWDDAMQWVNRFNEPPTTENVFDYLAMERAIEINPEAANAAMDAYNIHNDDALVMAEFRSIINEKIQQDSQSVSGGAGEGGGEKPAGQPDPIEAEARRIADADPSRTISLGTDANGEPVKMTVAEYLDAAKMEADQARKDVSLIQAAAECLMGNL